MARKKIQSPSRAKRVQSSAAATGGAITITA